MIVQEKTRDIGIIKSIGGSAEYGGGVPGWRRSAWSAVSGFAARDRVCRAHQRRAGLAPGSTAWRVEKLYSFDKIPDV
jgi:hypothetical protein